MYGTWQLRLTDEGALSLGPSTSVAKQMCIALNGLSRKSLLEIPFCRAVPLSTPPRVRTAAPRNGSCVPGSFKGGACKSKVRIIFRTVFK